jgi:pSer/pThr/pTyr-binding forkhead associated (FHA) protein
MTLTDFVERVGRAVFEAPFGGGPRSAKRAELSEIRHAILEEIERKCQRSSGRNLFPYNRITLRIQGADAQQASALAGDFLREYFESEIRAALLKAGAQHPEGLRVSTEVQSDPPANDEPWLAVETSFEKEEKPSKRVARLVVIEGAANVAELPLDRPRTNIGRSLDVYRTEGLSRRNHLAFLEAGEVNLTVSREHAHILRDAATGEYRVFNDRFYDREKRSDTCGVWIVRDGMSQEVPRDTRGMKLQSGDELRLGKAILRFEL